MLSLASRAEPYRCCSRAVNGSHSTLRLLATCRQDARIPVLLLAGFLVANPNPASLRETEETSYLAYGIVPLFPVHLAIFGRNYSLSTTPPTNFSMPAIRRGAAEASPRFAYAIMLTDCMQERVRGLMVEIEVLLPN